MDEEVENAEIVMTTLNGLPRSWDYFIQGICARRKLITFSRLWEECSQEEAQEEKMGNEDQTLTTHTKKIKREHYHLKKGKHPHQNQKDNPRKYSRDLSNVKCYTCDEKGHFARDCPRNRGSSHKKKNNKRRNYAHTAEDDEPPKKRTRGDSEDSSSDKEHVFILALTGAISHGSNDCLVDSGASKHMTGFKESFVNLSEHESPHKVKLGDGYRYPIKGSGEASYKINSGKYLKMKDVLYVPGLEKNLLSIFALDANGMRVAFIDGQVLKYQKERP